MVRVNTEAKNALKFMAHDTQKKESEIASKAILFVKENGINFFDNTQDKTSDLIADLKTEIRDEFMSVNHKQERAWDILTDYFQKQEKMEEQQRYFMEEVEVFIDRLEKEKKTAPEEKKEGIQTTLEAISTIGKKLQQKRSKKL